MKNWIYTLIDEKGYDLDHTFVVEGKDWDKNFIPLQVVVEHILIAPKEHQKAIKEKLVQIDFLNGDCLDFFKYLAKAIAK